MNNNFKYLAIISFFLFMSAFVCFFLGMRNEAPRMIGIAFIIVSLTLSVGTVGNWYFSKQIAQPQLQPATATPTTGPISQPVRQAETDPTEVIVSLVFGGIAVMFLAAGIWMWLFGGSLFFA